MKLTTHSKYLAAAWAIVLATAACKADAEVQKPVGKDASDQCFIDAFWNPNLKTTHEYARSVIDNPDLDGKLIACTMLDEKYTEQPLAMLFLPALPEMFRQHMKKTLNEPDEPFDWDTANIILGDDGEAR